MPVVPHVPWVQRNIPIPPGLYDDVCKVLKQKIDAGVYEHSNSSYRTRWFCVPKKDGKLRMVLALEALNAVTIQHSGVPPFTEEVAEHFAWRACSSMMDLYVGYDERALAPRFTRLHFLSIPFRPPQIYSPTNGLGKLSSHIHGDVIFILQAEIPEFTRPISTISQLGVQLHVTRKWRARNHSRKLRHTALRLGTLPRPKSNRTADEVLRRYIFRLQNHFFASRKSRF